jgi:putative hydroxymethylpyrimidine transport system substrate-binding protein
LRAPPADRRRRRHHHHHLLLRLLHGLHLLHAHRLRPKRAGHRRVCRAPGSVALIALGLACALSLSACATKQDVTSPPGVKPFSVMLDFFPNADHAALYSAIAHEDFRAVGLDVRPQTPAEPADPLKLLAAGRVDMAISYEPELLLARDQGLKLVSIGALVQRPLTSIIALPGQHVRAVADLAGKRVGTAGIGYQAAELHTALQAAGVSPSAVQEVNVGFNLIPAMLSGKVAATLGGFWNYEAIQLRRLHKHPLVIPVDRAGVPAYDELVLVVREDEARRRGQDLRAFMQALTHGEREVRADPQAAAALVVKANPSLEPALQLESIRQTLPAMLPASSSNPYGWQEPSAWASFGSWMLAHGLLTHNPNGGLPPFTNEFLPGQGI